MWHSHHIIEVFCSVRLEDAGGLRAQTVPLCISAGLRGRLTGVLSRRAVCCASKPGERTHTHTHGEGGLVRTESHRNKY